MDFEPLFRQICGHLRRSPDHIARILTGASCEPWLNAESSVALNFANPRALPAGLRAVPECESRDLVICCGQGRSRQTAVRVEAKLLWPGKYGSQLTELRRQLAKPARQDELRWTTNDPQPAAQRFGLLYLGWHGACSTRESPDQHAFMRNVERSVRQILPPHEFSLRSSWEVLVPRTVVDAGLKPYEVSLAATFGEFVGVAPQPRQMTPCDTAPA